jgi:predicted PurR-regulated permease PerM
VKQESLDPSQLIRVWTLVLVRMLLILLGVALLAGTLYLLRTLLLLLVVSIFFCYLIAPMVRIFEQPVYLGGRELRLPRPVAIGVVYVLMGAVLFFGAQFLVPILSEQLTDLGRNLPTYLDQGKAWATQTFDDVSNWMERLRVPVEWRDQLLNEVRRPAESLVPAAETAAVTILGYLRYLTWTILVPIFSFFLLKDAAAIEQGLVAWLPNERLRKRGHWLLLDVSRTLASYIRAQITACIVVALAVTAGFGLIGVPYALVLGFVAGLLEFVPLAGPLLAALISVALSLTVSVKLTLIVALFLAVFRIVQDYIIYPRIVGHGVKMHPLVVVLAILGGAEVAGLTGIFLAVPVVGLVIVVYRHYLAYRGLATLRVSAAGAQPASEPKVDVDLPVAVGDAKQ